MAELNWTGERLVTSLTNLHGTIEHLHRYALALEIANGKNVLDIACGEGYGSSLLSQVANNVYGVDIDENTITHASNKYSTSSNNLYFKVGSTSNIPLANKSIDVVVSFETIEHHDKHEDMMLEIKRVLKPGGILLISSPEKSIYKERDPNNVFHIKELTLNELKDLLQKHFKNTAFFRQQYIAGSLITPDEDNNGFKSYTGTYADIQLGLSQKNDFYNRPYFNLAICSDESTSYLPFSSLFDGASVLANIEDNLKTKNSTLSENFKTLKSSPEYRLGRFLTRRFGFIKKFIK